MKCEELVFIRHGQGIHNTAIPDRLNTIDPDLTEKGRKQVASLKAVFQFRENDLFIVSPTLRTMETANILTSDLLQPRKYITPLVGPRMFPMPLDADSYVVKCDWMYPIEKIRNDHPDFSIMEPDNDSLWYQGINTMNEAEFSTLANRLISQIKEKARHIGRAFVISHDGTITNYRVLFGEKGLSRADFLGEAGWHKVPTI